MFFNQLGRELAFHHDRIVALFIKGGQHGLHGEIFRKRVQTRDDNRHHLVALSAHGACGAGRGKTVLIHHRLNAFAGAFTHAAFIVEHTGNG